jgi:hypothetical protein
MVWVVIFVLDIREVGGKSTGKASAGKMAVSWPGGIWKSL